MNRIGVKGLSVEFVLPNQSVKVLDDFSIDFKEDKITGIIGESGSGKSVLGMAMLGILPNYAKVEGKIYFDGKEFEYKSKQQLSILGRKLGFIPQNPQESLNPSRKIKSQLRDVLKLKYRGVEIDKKEKQLLKDMGFEDINKILNSYPYELSGGMQQRVLSAISIALSPDWIIADEPTKGLDKELCSQVANTLKNLKQMGTKGMIVITHDLNLAELLCDEIYVMYNGRAVDFGKSEILKDPIHPYTRGLVDAMPENLLKPIDKDILMDMN